MALLYLDTSALVKLYVEEDGTQCMIEMAHPDAGHRLALLAIAAIEFRAAIRRRANLGDIDEATADNILAQFEQHSTTLFLVQPVNDAVLQFASQMVDRYGLRAYDATQLAGCLSLQDGLATDEELWFVTSDRELVSSGENEGLRVVDPTV